MLVGYKFRLYPNDEQKVFFAKTFGCVRFVYNKMLSDRSNGYKETGKNMKVNPADYKKDYPFLKEVDSLALTSAWNNLNAAFKNFFNKTADYPKFKSKKSGYKSYTTYNQNGTIEIVGTCVKLPKVGFVQMKQHRNVPGTIKSATISQVPSGKYYVSILVEQSDMEPLKQSDKVIGIDLGVKDLVVCSDGTKFDNIKPLYKEEVKLAKLQRQLSRKKQGSSNYKKQKRKVARCHEKITNVRKDYLHKLSHKLVYENQVIVSEDLAVKNMVKNHHLAKSISTLAGENLHVNSVTRQHGTVEYTSKLTVSMPAVRHAIAVDTKMKK